ncbi:MULTISPECIES: hypothetical protein [Thalassospira]|jgi:membrane protein implicated in regulation of membrane protease activity|uniref:Uncharacterized protein n=1 Tax=Thalassospira xiamenensis TaxID=220697 RepID=A0ABR5XZG8_9PROT|nr:MULTISPECIES: hypothetical protein [Thalassospira]MBL4840345.1 hypothetical protein [Thalassospira sp.]MBR9782105.1 hypothetical protein [Rhodospirillales bacterium]KZD02721.1 hypothetical protein AUP40_19850 [Thalassospira xiamenensis]KZD09933.1 hypothetical protein AUP45_12155 [Thalassospira xiamenensis]MBR9818908.1 hypothetical protein [Rhodospirillales bacterium]|tara:strand:+ start:2494 stop:2742 length:249 start_codon:yes stop_codon:yes gene_type:complete
MNKLASIIIAAVFAIALLGGMAAMIGGGLLGAIVFIIGIPVAFPMSTSIVVLFFAVIIIRTVMEKRRERREMRAFLKDNADD